MAKFDVGIFGWWYNMNYGANLTYFSLNRVVQKMGYSVGMVWKATDPDNVPDSTATRFANKYYDIGPAYSSDDMEKHNDHYNTFLLGSDQLWSPRLEKVSGKDFFFSFVDDSKGKVAYAQSIGRNIPLPEEFVDKYKKLVHRFDGISVREDYAVEVVKKGFDVNANQVCDPIFLSEKDIWDELINNSELELPAGKYVVNLILDPDQEKMDFCKKIRNDLNIKNHINFTALFPKVPWEKGFGEKPVPNTDGSIENLVKAYSKADFIITDSFHGTCLAIIFNKPFISIANYKRGIERFESLLRWLKIENRLVYDLHKPIYTNAEEIDYTGVNAIIDKSREKGLKWLREHLKGTFSVPRELGQKKCVGCGACVSVCPAAALKLQGDDYGYYRSYVDIEKCIDCKKCINVCPAINLPEKENNAAPELFAFQAKDKKILAASSSGGVFSLLANKILKDDGYVIGAAWNKDFGCEHIIIDKHEDLKKLNKSKYLQSYMGDIYKRIAELLKTQKPVLFSGCPCQVAGLKKYLAEEKENLFLVDLLCGNAPSAMFFKKYYIEEFGDSLKSYTFRIKDNGWNARSIRAELNSGDVILRHHKDNDNYQRVYHTHIMTPDHCADCIYQKIPRFGDITIGDFWHIKKHLPDLEVREGISAVLCNNKKGEILFNSIESNEYSLKKSVPLEWLGGNGYAVKGHNKKSPHARVFYKNILENSFTDVVNNIFESEEPVAGNKNADDILKCNYLMPYFSFEDDNWDVSYIPSKGVILHAKADRTERGHFAVLPLNTPLVLNKKYKLIIKGVVNTDIKTFNFHIAEREDPKNLQIIKRMKIDANKNQRIDISETFICKKNNMNSFSIGAAHLLGDLRNIIFEYISIEEV